MNQRTNRGQYGLRFERTASAAFRDHTYASAVERPARTGYGLAWWLAVCALGFAGLVLTVRGA